MRRPAVLAVDGGASKMDAVLLRKDGTVLAARRVASVDYEETGDARFLDSIERAVHAACEEAGIDPACHPVADVGVYCLAGADLPVDDRRIGRGLRARAWTERDLLRNDTFAVLRAGTDRTWGVGVVCGSGTNCTGVAPDGRIYRFAAIGDVSGDWGGAWDLGQEALWFALRAEDGRGEPTSLASRVAEHFGVRRARQVMEGLYLHRLDPGKIPRLAPVVFAEARTGDKVARSIVDRQADEIAAMATAAIRKLRMTRLDPDVVLGGGVFRNGWEPFFTRIEDRIHATAPSARVVRLTAPPVVGAAMLGLDVVGGPRAAHARARATLTHERLSAETSPERERS
ncbi:MAG: N-acetylglucosamine kinase [Planctomycetaceae bacterium]